MEEWQQHQLRLGYLRAALEEFVRLLHPDATEPGMAVEAAERRLHLHAEEWPVHARTVADHLRTHAPDGVPGASTPVAAAVAQVIALHEMVVRGRAAIPEPDSDADGNVFPTGHAEACALREGSTVVLLGIQLLMAAALQEDRVAVFDDKYLLDGMWIPDPSGSHWVDEEMPYGEYLAVLHLQPGEPPEHLSPAGPCGGHVGTPGADKRWVEPEVMTFGLHPSRHARHVSGHAPAGVASPLILIDVTYPRAPVGDGLGERDAVPREIHGIPPQCGPSTVDRLLQPDRLSEQLGLMPALVAPGVDGSEGAEEAGALGRYR